MNQTVIIENHLSLLTGSSTPEEITVTLEILASSKPDPIQLDLALRKVSNKLQTSLKAVRQTYDMVLKKIGYARVVQRGNNFSPPVECITAQNEFLAHGNPLFCFLNECLQEDSSSRVDLRDFRDAYTSWAKQQNISRLSILDKTLKRRLQSLGYTVTMNNGYPNIQGHRLAL